MVKLKGEYEIIESIDKIYPDYQIEQPDLNYLFNTGLPSFVIESIYKNSSLDLDYESVKELKLVCKLNLNFL